MEELGFKIDTVFAILSFRKKEYYTYFKNKGIKVEYIFDLNDLSQELGVKIKDTLELEKMTDYPFNILGKFASENPNLQYVIQKSDPVLDDKKVYFGSDSGYFGAINKNDGSVAGKFKVGLHAKGKSIFSNPVIYKNLVIFGSYDGNLYALDKETGKKEGINFDADGIGSSPCIAEDLGLGFVGLEFGLFKKRGGILAFDLKTGKMKGKEHATCYTHSSPLYIESKKQVVIGGNDGVVKLYNAKNGIKLGEFKSEKITEDEKVSGFSSIDIKESFAYDKKRDYIIFGNIKGVLYIETSA